MTTDPSRRTRLPGKNGGKLLHISSRPGRVTTTELPELLVTTTVRVALRIGRDGLPPALVLPPRAAQLVCDVLKALAGN